MGGKRAFYGPGKEGTVSRWADRPLECGRAAPRRTERATIEFRGLLRPPLQMGVPPLVQRAAVFLDGGGSLAEAMLTRPRRGAHVQALNSD